MNDEYIQSRRYYDKRSWRHRGTETETEIETETEKKGETDISAVATVLPVNDEHIQRRK